VILTPLPVVFSILATFELTGKGRVYVHIGSLMKTANSLEKNLRIGGSFDSINVKKELEDLRSRIFFKKKTGIEGS
jgi:hypothetical protein